MSNHANFVIVNDEGSDVYNWSAGGYYVLRWVFFGPDIAISAIEDFFSEHGPSKTLYSPGVCEAGALIDPGRKKLLVFSSDIGNILEHRLYLNLLRVNWPGWKVRWAYQGSIDFSFYLHLPKEVILEKAYLDARGQKPPIEMKCLPNFGTAEQSPCMWSAREADGQLRVGFPQRDDYWPDEIFLFGPQALRYCEDLPILTNPMRIELPNYGLHVDMGVRKIFYWAEEILRPRDFLQSLWEGWELVWLEDRFEEHLEMLGGLIECEREKEGWQLNSIMVEIRNEVSDYPEDNPTIRDPISKLLSKDMQERMIQEAVRNHRRASS